MEVRRHAREEIASFFVGEFRQVWAVDRETGRPHYLPEGGADEFRTVARDRWKCPFPDCEVPITTRGGSRRAHFVHLGQPGHETGGESEAHLAAKAMLADWARVLIPAGGQVRQEEPVRSDSLDVHRVADVMATWPDGLKMAFEVEYKAFTAAAWVTKQADYDRVGIGCVWLIGHTRVPPRQGFSPTGRGAWVHLSPLAQAITGSGRPLFVINPMTRQVGTVAANPNLSDRPRGDVGLLLVDDIDQCTLDPVRGLVTPTSARIEEAIANRTAQEARTVRRDTAAAAAQVRRRRAQTASAIAESETRWLATDLHATFLDRWGHVPDVLAERLPFDDALGTAPVWWHALVYETFVHGRRPFEDFTVEEVVRWLRRTGLPRSATDTQVLDAVGDFLGHLQANALLRTVTTPYGQVLSFKPTGFDADQVDAAKVARYEKHQATEAARRARQDGRRERAVRSERERAARGEAEASAARERREERDAVRRAAHERWVASAEHAEVLAVAGTIPGAITWSAVTVEEFAASSEAPARWHARLWLDHVVGRPADHRFTTGDAVATLLASPVPVTSDAEVLTAAVEGYLGHLCQRGALTEGEGGAFTVRATPSG